MRDFLAFSLGSNQLKTFVACSLDRKEASPVPSTDRKRVCAPKINLVSEIRITQSFDILLLEGSIFNVITF
jgi:hypothetical protein